MVIGDSRQRLKSGTIIDDSQTTLLQRPAHALYTQELRHVPQWSLLPYRPGGWCRRAGRFGSVRNDSE